MAANPDIYVLMVTLAMAGHVNPLHKFAKVLVSKGISVTLAVNEVANHKFIKNWTENTCEKADKKPGIQLVFYSDGLGLDFDREGNVGIFISALRTAGCESFSTLLAELSKAKKFSCIIVSPFVPWAIDVAYKNDIPCAVLWIQASAVFSIYYNFFKSLNSFGILENPNEIVQVPGLPALKVKDLPSFIIPPRPPHFEKLLSEFFEYLEKAKWVLGASFEELEEETVKSMASISPILSIGPLVSPFLLGREEIVSPSVDVWQAEEFCMQWLDTQKPSSVIYVSFGSLIVLTKNQIQTIGEALRNSKKPFLWVVRHNGTEPVEKMDELMIGFEEETKERSLIVRWCPQEKVLKHKAVACFLTHCGWNSTLETLVCGVPVIAYPEWTDQPTNAKLLADIFKVGVIIEEEEDGRGIRREEVEKRIYQITEGPSAKEMKKKAVALKEAAKRAVDKGGSSHRNIEKFIAEMVDSVGNLSC